MKESVNVSCKMLEDAYFKQCKLSTQGARSAEISAMCHMTQLIAPESLHLRLGRHSLVLSPHFFCILPVTLRILLHA